MPPKAYSVASADSALGNVCLSCEDYAFLTQVLADQHGAGLNGTKLSVPESDQWQSSKPHAAWTAWAGAIVVLKVLNTDARDVHGQVYSSHVPA